MSFVNNKAFLGTVLAHNDGGVPNMIINIPEINEYYLGMLIYFFEKACGISGYILDVNPFNQPGVEAYKKNMFALLGKPGYEAEKDALEKQAEEKGLSNVIFCGVIPHEKVFTLLKEASLSFIPLKSSKMKDSVPTKIYEALGVGCPVLLVAEGDSCGIVNATGMGVCVSPDETEKLTEAFDSMVENYAEIIKKRTETTEIIKKKYSRQQAAAEFENKLRQLV